MLWEVSRTRGDYNGAGLPNSRRNARSFGNKQDTALLRVSVSSDYGNLHIEGQWHMRPALHESYVCLR